ncbi:hypothetical protein HMPREF1587_02054 [Bifidobacterium breve JCP7499]|nr:hypothetical protein HMPREF1587_02054 [Bifidobacterium breve JCP7499]
MSGGNDGNDGCGGNLENRNTTYFCLLMVRGGRSIRREFSA